MNVLQKFVKIIVLVNFGVFQPFFKNEVNEVHQVDKIHFWNYTLYLC